MYVCMYVSVFYIAVKNRQTRYSTIYCWLLRSTTLTLVVVSHGEVTLNICDQLDCVF
jgi:hypothetical protein